MFSFNPNPDDLYRPFWRGDRADCWESRQQRRDFIKAHIALTRKIPDRKTRAEAEADLKRLVEANPELAGKLTVNEFNYL